MKEIMSLNQRIHIVYTTCGTCGAGTAYHSGAPEFTSSGFSGLPVAWSLISV
jgi:hypothetical protein